jgi:hypothetical protein
MDCVLLCIISCYHNFYIKIICELFLKLCRSQFQNKTIFYVSILIDATLTYFLVTKVNCLYSVN